MTIRQLEAPLLALAFLLCGLPIWLGGLRWRAALRVQGMELSLGELLRISLVAHFFNAFLLGATGGDVVKAWYAARLRSDQRTEAALTVVVDRLVGTFFLLVFALALLPLAWRVDTDGQPVFLFLDYRRYQAVALLLTALCAVAGLAGFAGFYTSWLDGRSLVARLLGRLPGGPSLARALSSCRRFGRTRGYMLRSAAFSLGINLALVATFLALAHGLRIEVPDRVLWFLVPAVVCVAALPVTPSGLGVREHLFVALLAVPAFPLVKPAEALSLALLGYLVNLLWSVIGGVAYLLGPGAGPAPFTRPPGPPIAP